MVPDPAEEVFAVVCTVPRGTVVTYGQVAELVDSVSLSPRQVGAIMHDAPPGVPWHRVVGAGGHLPIGKRSPHMESRQRELLAAEGVGFLETGRVDMARHQWRPEGDGTASLFDEV